MGRTSRAERALPFTFGCAAGILHGLGRFPEARQHRVDAALQHSVPLADRILHAGILAQRLERFELVVEIEDDARERRPSCHARSTRMQADDEERAAADAEREIDFGRIAAHAAIPDDAVLMIVIVQRLQLLPEQALEARLVGRRVVEHRDEAHGHRTRIGKFLRIADQRLPERLRRSRIGHRTEPHEPHAILVEGRFGADARKRLFGDERFHAVEARILGCFDFFEHEVTV